MESEVSGGMAQGAAVGFAVGGPVGAAVGFAAGGLIGFLSSESKKDAQKKAMVEAERKRRMAVMKEMGVKQQASNMALASLNKGPQGPQASTSTPKPSPVFQGQGGVIGQNASAPAAQTSSGTF